MSLSPKVGIVVLNYNGQHCLAACLRSLENLDYETKDVIVVDNGSTDGSFADAKERFPHYTYLGNAKNQGFAGGMNVGMRAAIERGATWVWIFNNDATADPQALSSLLSVARAYPQAGLVSPVICTSETTSIWFAKGKIDVLRMRTLHLLPTAEKLKERAYASEFLTGCALLIKKEVIETIGFLDERFFLYYEDADYSLRAAQAGFSCLVAPGARVFHSETSHQRAEKAFFLVYSGLLFFAKHDAPGWRLYHRAYVMLRRVKNFLDRLCNKKSAMQVYRAYQEYFYER